VLVVDDNRLYREAIRRNLEFVDYNVLEAENLRTALEEIRTEHPQMVITDLDMTHRTEGLDVIKEVKSRYPLMPIILVSAVGTFEEGAKAQELGATSVISKSRIDEELEHLYDRLDRVFEQIQTLTRLRTRVDKVMMEEAPASDEGIEDEINALIASNTDKSIKGELYDWLSQIRDKQTSVEKIADASSAINLETGSDGSAVAGLEKELGTLDEFDPETRTMVIAAERLMTQVDPKEDSGWAMNVVFSYSFAVENEVKQKLGKKLAKLVSMKELKGLLRELYDPRHGNLSLGLSRFLLLNKTISEDINQDLVRQILERMTQHGEKYKADGLKALGVIAYLFGQKHEFDDLGKKVRIDNPLGIEGLEPEETTKLGALLVRLQHTRNPFIHPEFSEREKLTEMRKLTIDCLGLVKRILE
jgi:CheY-like chemotaxis protein